MLVQVQAVAATTGQDLKEFVAVLQSDTTRLLRGDGDTTEHAAAAGTSDSPLQAASPSASHPSAQESSNATCDGGDGGEISGASSTSDARVSAALAALKDLDAEGEPLWDEEDAAPPAAGTTGSETHTAPVEESVVTAGVALAHEVPAGTPIVGERTQIPVQIQGSGDAEARELAKVPTSESTGSSWVAVSEDTGSIHSLSPPQLSHSNPADASTPPA